MKKLKLFGKEALPEIIPVATIYFNDNEELVVDSEYPEVKEDLTKEIERISFPSMGDLDVLKHILGKIGTASLENFRISKEKIIGKRLEFYGRKLSEQKHVATIYVDRNKKVIVEAEDPRVKEDLLKAIYDPEAPDELPVFIIRVPGPPEEEEKDRKEGVSRTWAKAQRPGDPEFLEALGTELFGEKYGDYYISWFDIVKE